MIPRRRPACLSVSLSKIPYCHFVLLRTLLTCNKMVALGYVYTVHITSNLHKFDKCRVTLLWILMNCYAASHRMSVLWPRNVRALAQERPCCVRRTSVLCPRNVRAVYAERPCSVRGTSVLCPCISVLSAAHPQSE